MSSEGGDEGVEEMLLEAFKAADVNNDGVVSASELQGLLVACTELTEKSAEILIKSFDKNGDGVFQYEEFVSWLLGGEKVTTSKSGKAVDLIDGEVVLFAGETNSWHADDWTVDVPWLKSEKISGRLVSLRVRFSWIDHGWGDGIGKVVLKLVSSHKVLVSMEPSSSIGVYRRATGSEERLEVDATLDEASDIVKQARVGDHLEVYVDVGGRCCELYVEDFTCTAVVAAVTQGERGVPFSHGLDLEKLHTARTDDPSHVQLLKRAFPFQGRIEKTEHRAISAGQLARVVDFVRQHGARWWDRMPAKYSRTAGLPLTVGIFNLYHMNEWVILPSTKEEDVAFVELLSAVPQKPDWFVSHWWGELVIDFLRCVQAHCDVRRLSPDTKYWVCAYANRQHSLASEIVPDPRDTSFYKALSSATGVLLVLDDELHLNSQGSGPATPFTRIWCCYELSVITQIEAAEQGGGKDTLFDIVSSSGTDVHILTDGVAEADRTCPDHPPSFWKARREQTFLLPVIQRAMKADISKGEATAAEDRKHILNSIAGTHLEGEPPGEHDSYEVVSRYLRSTFAVPAWRRCLEKGVIAEFNLPAVVAGDPFRTALELDVSGTTCRSPTEGIVPVVTDMKGLRELRLDLSHTSVSSDDLQVVAAAIGARHLTALSLNLIGCDVSIRDLEGAFQSNTGALQQLKLSFKGNRVLEQQGLSSLGRRLPSCIKELSLDIQSRENVAEDMPGEWATFATALCNLANLEKLSLQLDIGGDSGAALPQIMSSVRSLSVVQTFSFTQAHSDFAGNVYSLEGCQHLAALTKLRSLTFVLDRQVLENSDKLMAGLTCNGDGREALEELTLWLFQCDVGLQRNLLQFFPALRRLDLNLAWLPTTGLENLSSLRHLEELSLVLEECDYDVSDVLAAVGALSSLRQLTLSLVQWKSHAPLDITALATALASGALQSLCKLHLDFSQYMNLATITGLGKLAESVSLLPSVRDLSLNFNGCYAKEEPASGVEHARALSKSTESLVLDHFRVSYWNCFQLPPVLRSQFNTRAAFQRAVAAIA